MPLARYFFYVGGVLLALLLVLDARLPKFPVTERTHANLPVIRIHSVAKLPELSDNSPLAMVRPPGSSSLARS